MAKSRVKKRPDGRYVMQIYIGMVDGKRKYKSVYGTTPKEVERKAQEVRIMLGKGMDVAAMRDTVQDWAERMINIKAAKGISASQIRNYKNYIAHLSSISNMPITEVRPVHIQDIIDSLAKPHNGRNGLAKKTLIQIRNTALQIFEVARENRVTEYNPAQYVVIPQDSTQKFRGALTAEQQSWIRNTPHRAQRAAMIMMYSGLRRGEVTALTWSDIDLTAGKISVTKSVEMINGRPKIKPPKTAAGNRIVLIPNILVDFLREEKRTENPLCLYVVHTVHGDMMTNQAWRSLWESYITDLNIKYGYDGKANKYSPCKLQLRIPYFTPHWLRHTFASLLYFSGVDVLTARDQMGHSDIKTTLEIYTHLDQKYKMHHMDKLNSFLNNASQMQVRISENP